MAAALRSKSSRDAASLAVYQFRHCILNHMHEGPLASFQWNSRSKWDNKLFRNSRYSSNFVLNPFKPFCLRGDLMDKGTEYRKNHLNSCKVNKKNRMDISSSYGDPPEVWQPPGGGGGIMVRPGKFVQTGEGEGPGAGTASGGGSSSGSKDGCWGGSNLGPNFPTPKDLL